MSMYSAESRGGFEMGGVFVEYLQSWGTRLS